MSEPSYPAESQLRLIRDWDYKDFPGLMEFIRPIWEFADVGYWQQDGVIYRISTAGWSGNEDIIGAMQENQMIWVMNWYQSRRGGHYIFAPTTLGAIKLLEESEKG